MSHLPDGPKCDQLTCLCSNQTLNKIHCSRHTTLGNHLQLRQHAESMKTGQSHGEVIEGALLFVPDRGEQSPINSGSGMRCVERGICEGDLIVRTKTQDIVLRASIPPCLLLPPPLQGPSSACRGVSIGNPIPTSR